MGYSPWGRKELDTTEQLSMSAAYSIFLLGGEDFVCRRFGATEEVGGWGRAPGRVWTPPWVSVGFVGASYLGSKDAGKLGGRAQGGSPTGMVRRGWCFSTYPYSLTLLLESSSV